MSTARRERLRRLMRFALIGMVLSAVILLLARAPRGQAAAPEEDAQHEPRGASRRMRLVLFGIACFAVLPCALSLAGHMPRFGAHPLPYGDAINARAPAERRVTNTVSAVNFDYRGFDTLGEEFMLLCAVTGVTVLLRGARGEQRSAEPGGARRIVPRSDATLVTGRIIAPMVVLFGLYVALHAMTTPGGGFQGGVIIASGLLLLYLAEDYRTWRRMVHSSAVDAAEGAGATLYALCGFASMALGLPYLQNMLPLGKLGDLFSGGLMLVENAGVALAVAGGFTILFIEFLEETRVIPDADKA
jgi:multicomponent Na+:H+ antiporter subunit B